MQDVNSGDEQKKIVNTYNLSIVPLAANSRFPVKADRSLKLFNSIQAYYEFLTIFDELRK